MKNQRRCNSRIVRREIPRAYHRSQAPPVAELAHRPPPVHALSFGLLRLGGWVHYPNQTETCLRVCCSAGASRSDYRNPLLLQFPFATCPYFQPCSYTTGPIAASQRTSGMFLLSVHPQFG